MTDLTRVADLKTGERFCLPPGEPTLLLTDIPTSDQLVWCVDVETGKGVRLHLSDPVQRLKTAIETLQDMVVTTPEQFRTLHQLLS